MKRKRKKPDATETALPVHADTALMEENRNFKEEKMYPRLVIDINKLRNNLDAVAHITKEEGNCSLMYFL